MSNKVFLSSIFAILTLVGCIFIGGCTEQTSENGEKDESGYLTYENTQYNLKIKYPDNWMKQENYLPNTVVVFSIEPGMMGVLNCSLSITSADTGALSIDQIKDSHIENLSIFYTNLNISYDNTTTLAGLPAYKLIFTYSQGTYIIKQMEVWTVKNNNLYFLTYISNEDNYENNLQTIEYMINSFEIL